MNEPIVFMAYYYADPTGGGLLHALDQEGIWVKALVGQETTANEVPPWVPMPKSVTYYFVVRSADAPTARKIAQRLAHPAPPSFIPITGLEMYDALKAAINGSESFEINSIDVKDLGKLTPSDLESRGFSDDNAETVSS